MLTVSTPCYNHGKYLEEAILSVLNQSYSDFKYVLVNDGSTDDSLDIMRAYEKLDDRIEVIDQPKQQNKTIGLNKTIQGKLWLWCPADDILKQDCILHKMLSIRSYPCVLYNYGFDIINQYGELTSIVSLAEKSIEDFWKHVWSNCDIAFTGALFDCRVFDIVGKFPEEENISEDFKWMLKACILKVPFIGLQDNQHYKRINPESASAKNSTLLAENTAKIRREVADTFDKTFTNQG